MTDMKTFKIEALTDENYSSWKHDVEQVLILADLWEFVESKEAPTTEKGKKLDAKAKAVISLNVSTALRPLVHDCARAFDVWKKLKETYDSSGYAGILENMQLLLTLQIGDDSMGTYFAKVQKIRDGFVSAGEDVSETLIALAAMKGLPPQYSTYSTVIKQQGLRDMKMMKVEESVGEETGQPKATAKPKFQIRLADVLATMRQAEQQLNSEENAGSSAAAYTARGGRTRSAAEQDKIDRDLRLGLCHHCGEKGHIAHDCPDKMTEEDRRATKALAARCRTVVRYMDED